MAIDRKIFFDHVRPTLFGGFLGDVGKQQIAGLDTLLTEWELRGGGDLRWFAYMLATAFLETNHTMQPVREAYWLSETWRKAHLRYWPWYGRGYDQMTWKTNYAKADKELKLDGKLLANPDLALQPAIAAKTLFLGMVEGWFTGKKLADYIGGAKCDYVGARDIINGTDRAQEVANHALAFEKALRMAYAGTPAPDNVPIAVLTPSKPTTEKPKPPATQTQTGALGAAVTGAIVAGGGGATAGHPWLIGAAVAAAVVAVVVFIIVRRKG